MAIGKKIKELRTEKGLTQKQVAQSIGYSTAIIGFWENGQKDPTGKAIIALANYFGVSADYLLGLKDY